MVQLPLPVFLNSPRRPRIETALSLSPRLLSSAAYRDRPSTPVLIRVGPGATEQLQKERSGTGQARPLWAEVRRARLIAIGVVVICVSAPLGAAIPLLLSLLGR